MNDPLRNDLQSLQHALKAFEEGFGVRKLIEEQFQAQERLRATVGPYEDIRRSMERLHVTLRPDDGVRKVAEQVAAMSARFTLPEVPEAARLARQLHEGSLAQAIKRTQEQYAEIERAVALMRAPWLDMQDKMRSIAGFAALQDIGNSLRALPSFDVQLVESLRIELGDWRKEIDWPSGIFEDPLARTAFYARQGLDSGLTAFPASAFEQGLGIAGLKDKAPPYVNRFDRKADPEDIDPQEHGFRRTNEAHDRLQRFESQLRGFISEQMQTRFGEKWIKQRVPGEIWKKWAEKREKARENGEASHPLIAYADFTDYVPIITRSDNWTDVFEPIFRRTTSVQESFQRLYPIRICTMHARIITQDDELYLYVETKRILAAIGVKI